MNDAETRGLSVIFRAFPLTLTLSPQAGRGGCRLVEATVSPERLKLDCNWPLHPAPRYHASHWG